MCCVCLSDDTDDDNLLIFCDGPDCDVCVHQLCYGVQVIPKEDQNWYCDKCESDDCVVRH